MIKIVTACRQEILPLSSTPLETDNFLAYKHSEQAELYCKLYLYCKQINYLSFKLL